MGYLSAKELIRSDFVPGEPRVGQLLFRLDDSQPGYLDKMPSIEGSHLTSTFQGGGRHDKVVGANHTSRGFQSCPDSRVLECR